MNQFSVTIIIGATNESSSLIETIQSIVKNCRQQDIERIIIVHSKNATVECRQAILSLEEAYPHIVKSLEQIRPYVGGAVKDAFECVHSSHLMLVSADLSIGLESIPQLIEEEKNNPVSIVKVSRWLKPDSFHQYPVIRKAFNACAQSFLRVLFHSKLSDLTAPAQIMPVNLCKSIEWKEQRYSILIELILSPLRLGVQILEVPGCCYGRKEGKSGNSFLQTASYLKTALRIRFTKPEKLLKPGINNFLVENNEK